MLNPKSYNVTHHDRIAQLAHELWEQEGRPEGRALEHWLTAESRMSASAGQATSSLVAGEDRSSAARGEPQREHNSNGNRNGQPNRSKSQKRVRA